MRVKQKSVYFFFDLFIKHVLCLSFRKRRLRNDEKINDIDLDDIDIYILRFFFIRDVRSHNCIKATISNILNINVDYLCECGEGVHFSIFFSYSVLLTMVF